MDKFKVQVRREGLILWLQAQRDGYNAKHVSLGENVGEAVKEVRALVVMPISQMTDDDALEMEDLNAALYEYLN